MSVATSKLDAVDMRCPSCESADFADELRKESDSRGEGAVELVRCRSCRLVYLRKRNDEFAPELYSYYGERIGLTREQVYNPITESRYLGLLQKFGDMLQRQGLDKSVLDVGCGAGHFVDVAKRGGWNALGIELSEHAVTLGDSLDAPVKRMDVFSEEIAESSSSLVTLFELIEHVPHPQQILQRAADILVSGGFLYLTTPNFNSLDRRLEGSDWHAIHREHLIYFDVASMTQMLSNVKTLKLIYVKTRNFTPSSLRRLYPSRLKQRNKIDNMQGGAAAGGCQLRERIEQNALLGVSKSVINGALNFSGMGNSMYVLLQKSC